MQELVTMNVQMRIITSDNIDVLTTKTSHSISVSSKNVFKAGENLKELSENEDVNNDSDIDNNENDFNEDDDYNDVDINVDKPYSGQHIEDNGSIDKSSYNSINDTIVQHNIFNVGDTVIHIPSNNMRPWKIKEIDNSKTNDNIRIFTLLMDDLGGNRDLPPNSIIQERVYNETNQCFNIPVFLLVSINDIRHFETKNMVYANSHLDIGEETNGNIIKSSVVLPTLVKQDDCIIGEDLVETPLVNKEPCLFKKI